MIEIEKYIDNDGLFHGRYLLLRQLSTEGGTADVWLAEDKETADKELSEENDDEVVEVEGSAVLVAIKIYRPKNILDAEGIQTFKKEYKTVYNCHHANLLKPTGFSIIDDSIPYLVMPYCEKGSAEKRIGHFSSTDDIWKFIYDTASGLAYLHSCNPPIIHQDIKPANILIDINGNYCITDFGISVKRGKNDDEHEDESSGTIIYMPPERFGDNYSPIPQSDIWSLGATIYEILTGDVPFGNDGGAAQKNGITISEIKANVPRKIKKLVYACLNADPYKRPTAERIADIARRKGKGYAGLNAIIVAVIVAIVGMFILNISSNSISVSPFDASCNSADSIIRIEKTNAEGEQPINALLSEKHLREAADYYKNALQEEVSNPLRKDSVKNRIYSIYKLSPMYERYKGVCDSLQMAIDDEAEIQKALLEKRRNDISDIIKNKIIEL